MTPSTERRASTRRTPPQPPGRVAPGDRSRRQRRHHLHRRAHPRRRRRRRRPHRRAHRRHGRPHPGRPVDGPRRVRLGELPARHRAGRHRQGGVGAGHTCPSASWPSSPPSTRRRASPHELAHEVASELTRPRRPAAPTWSRSSASPRRRGPDRCRPRRSSIAVVRHRGRTPAARRRARAVDLGVGHPDGGDRRDRRRGPRDPGRASALASAARTRCGPRLRTTIGGIIAMAVTMAIGSLFGAAARA